MKRGKGASRGLTAASVSITSSLPLFELHTRFGLLSQREFNISAIIKPKEWHKVLGFEIAFDLHVSSVAQTLVIAVTSCAMLFEELIMDSDNEGKRAWLHPTVFSSSLYSLPLLCQSSV